MRALLLTAGQKFIWTKLGYDSHELFAPFAVAKTADYEKHLNKYHVLHFDAATFSHRADDVSDTVRLMDRAILREFQDAFPECMDKDVCSVVDARDNAALITAYLRYLRGFFKTEESERFLALGYLTGILFEGESATGTMATSSNGSTGTETRSSTGSAPYV